jgi:hypothetical protein
MRIPDHKILIVGGGIAGPALPKSRNFMRGL